MVFYHLLLIKKITISLTDQAYQMIQEEGFDPIYGARPIKRFIQKEIETPLSRKIIAGEIETNSKVTIDFDNGFVFK